MGKWGRLSSMMVCLIEYLKDVGWEVDCMYVINIDVFGSKENMEKEVSTWDRKQVLIT